MSSSSSSRCPRTSSSSRRDGLRSQLVALVREPRFVVQPVSTARHRQDLEIPRVEQSLSSRREDGVAFGLGDPDPLEPVLLLGRPAVVGGPPVGQDGREAGTTRVPLAGALEALSDPQRRRTLGLAARERAVREYSWTAHCEALDRAMKNLTLQP